VRVGLLAAGLLGLAAAGPGTAHASGFDLPYVGSTHSGPVTRDAAAVHHNPAQLVGLVRPELMIVGGAVVAHVGYRREYRGTYAQSDTLQLRDPIDPAYVDAGKTGPTDRVTTTPAGPVGGLFAAFAPIQERLALGVGIAVPHAAILDFPATGPQRFAVQRAFLSTFDVGGGVAVRLHDMIALGASASWVLGLLELSKVQDFAAVDDFHTTLARPPVNQANDFGSDAPSTVRELDVLARPIRIENVVSHGVTFGAGLAIRPADRVDLALVYRHGSRFHGRGEFMLDMNDDFFTQDLASEGLSYPPVARGRAIVDFRLPMRVLGAVGVTVGPRLRLEARGSWVAWHRLDAFRITLRSPDLAQPELGVPPTSRQPLERRWRDVGEAELWARIRPAERVSVSAMIGYASPASPDSTIDAASPDGHRVQWAGGVAVVAVDRLTLLVDAELHHAIPRTVSTSDHDLGNGRYDLFVAQLGVGARVFLGPAGAKPAPARGLPKSPPPR
jgi:long-chain fatty acid transport protein